MSFFCVALRCSFSQAGDDGMCLMNRQNRLIFSPASLTEKFRCWRSPISARRLSHAHNPTTWRAKRAKRRRTSLRIYADEILTSDTILSVLLPFFLSFFLPFSPSKRFSLSFDVNGAATTFSERSRRGLNSVKNRKNNFHVTNGAKEMLREAAFRSGANVYLFDFLATRGAKQTQCGDDVMTVY